MRKLATLVAFVVAALFAARCVAAQTSKSANASVTIHWDGNLTLQNVQGLSYGTHFTTDAPLASASVPTAALWTGTINTGASISVTFSIPSSLSDGGSNTVSFSCGALSADVNGSGFNSGGFDPNVGLGSVTVTSADGSFNIHLGADPGSGSCVVGGPTSASGNFKSYSGTITATVTAL
jgi:hypothetical protein